MWVEGKWALMDRLGLPVEEREVKEAPDQSKHAETSPEVPPGVPTCEVAEQSKPSETLGQAAEQSKPAETSPQAPTERVAEQSKQADTPAHAPTQPLPNLPAPWPKAAIPHFRAGGTREELAAGQLRAPLTKYDVVTPLGNGKGASVAAGVATPTPSEGALQQTPQQHAAPAEAPILKTQHESAQQAARQPTPPAELPHKVEAAVKKAAFEEQRPQQQQNLPNSSTHRKEWAVFTRQSRNPAKMSQELQPMMEGSHSRLDLFRMWLDKAQSFAACEVEIRRRNVQRQTASNSELAMSRRMLEQDPRYSKEDVEDLVRCRTAEGRYTVDPNFPQREDLRLYLVHDKIALDNSNVREDSQQVRGFARLDGHEALSLTDDGADFASQAPSIPAPATLMSTQGLQAALGEKAGDAEPKAKAKGKPRARKAKGKAATEEDPNAPSPEPVVPKTPLEKATALKKTVHLGIS